MVRQIVRDPVFLGMKSEPATAADLWVAEDLLDTLRAHADGCAGMAANMIGVRKAVIAFFDGGKPRVMLNPRILRRSGEFEAEEGCLSLDGVRRVTRYSVIKVAWENLQMEQCAQRFIGFTAQVIQHEVDHCNGIMI